MPLKAYCPGCKEATSVRSNASTRVELEQEKGEILSLNCQHCGKNFPLHVNDVFAKPNSIILIGGFVLGVLLTAILWSYYGLVAGASLVIPILVYQQQNQVTSAFNKHRIRRTK